MAATNLLISQLQSSIIQIAIWQLLEMTWRFLRTFM